VFADIMTAMEWLLSNASSNSGNQNQESIATLESMGFTSRQAEKALLTCDGNVERAIEWLFNNPDNAGEEHERSSSDEFESGNDYELVGFISHMGANTACGHYVCHLKKVNIVLTKACQKACHILSNLMNYVVSNLINSWLMTSLYRMVCGLYSTTRKWLYQKILRFNWVTCTSINVSTKTLRNDSIKQRCIRRWRDNQ